MRKQMKIAAVISAAALLALGASITSFAAQKGTWKYEDGEWYCYDKNGDVYENTFCLSNGKEFYVGDNGEMVTSSWVEYDGDYYFVNSSGQKIVNDWRLTTPYDDESADEEWYFFQSSGKMASSKKLTVKGKTYFFGSDGQMLTGWVTADGSETVDEANGFSKKITFYCDETGARLEKAWVYSVEPGTDEDDTDADEYYYYLKSNGQAATGKQNNISGQTYFFDEEGKMLTGWVGKVESGSDAVYEEIDEEGSQIELGTASHTAFYYCGPEDDGHMKKNKWIKLWRPKDAYDEDEDQDKFWYYVEKNGEVFIPSDSDASATKFKFEDGKLVDNGDIEIAKKKVNSKDYFFNKNGEMVAKFVKVTNVIDTNSGLANGMYYFGGANDGSMKTGSQTIKDDNDESYKFYFETKTTSSATKGVGVTGNKSSKLYYDGMLIKSDDYRYQVADVDGTLFIVNQNGAIQHSNTQYKEDGDILINASDKVAVEFVNTGSYEKYSLKNGLTGVTNLVPVIDAKDAVYR